MFIKGGINMVGDVRREEDATSMWCMDKYELLEKIDESAWPSDPALVLFSGMKNKKKKRLLLVSINILDKCIIYWCVINFVCCKRKKSPLSTLYSLTENLCVRNYLFKS